MPDVVLHLLLLGSTLADHDAETIKLLLHLDWEEECLGDQMIQYVSQGEGH